MATKLDLRRGEDFFTEADLLRLAIEDKNEMLDKNSLDAAFVCSKPLGEYILDDRLLGILAENGIRRQARPDTHDTIFTLVDEHVPLVQTAGYSLTSYWNFQEIPKRPGKFDLRVTLKAGLRIMREDDGVRLFALAFGSFVTPSSPDAIIRMFSILTEADDDPRSGLAKELAANKEIIVTWGDLDLKGIRTISGLFNKFSGSNNAVETIARHREIFDPLPYPYNQKSGDQVYITRLSQPLVLQAWYEQLQGYRDSLAVLPPS